MFIKAFCSRQEEWVPEDNNFETDYDTRRFHGELVFFADKDYESDDPVISDKIMATVAFTFFEGPVYEKEDMKEMVEIADNHPGDDYEALCGLYRSLHYSDIEIWSSMSCTVYLKTLYIEEDFRQKGLATWILQNLPALLRHYFRVEAQYVVTIPSPDGYIKLDKYEPEEQIKIKEMQNLMVSVIRKNGFYKVRKQNIYYKKFDSFEY